MTSVLVAMAALLLTGGGYAVACWWAPFTDCGRCEGRGERTTWLLRRTVRCAPCKGTGRRVRLGRRLHTRAARLHDRGTR
jgi:DnaJ-class molecular chaperone